MTEKEKLILATMQINSLLRLLECNEYQKYLYGHLIKTTIELNRQLKFYE